MGEQAKDEIDANMPLVEGIFFEIHGSELKPDPAEIAGQAAKICKAHSAFFFSVSEHTFYGFLAAFVKITQRRSVAVVLNKLEVVCPDVLVNNLDVLLVFSTLEF